MENGKLKFFLIFLPLFLFGGDFDDIDLSIDLDDVDKPYSYKGYLKVEGYYIDKSRKYFKTNNELNLEGDYKKGLWYFKENWSGYYTADRYEEKSYGIVNELYAKYGDVNKNLTVGKELLKWGKGYAYSAVSFFTRPKNPLYPEDLKQGYEVVHFKMIKTLNKSIKNYSVDLIYMPANYSLNSDLQKSQNYGGKLYMLYKDIDIDLMFEKSNVYNDKFGGDFSFNLLTELELHGEYAFDKSDNSYLLGLKYATSYDLTITSEWYKTWNDNRFIYAKASKKDFLKDYLTAYIIGIRNYTKNLNSLLLGGKYDFKNNFILVSEFLVSTKQKEVKLSISYYF